MVVAAVCSALSAVWPVEYDATGIVTAHPVSAAAPPAVAVLWSAVAHPAYIAFQILWVVAVVARWRTSGPPVRRQLVRLVPAAAASVVALVAGLAGWGTPVPGLLAATLVPVATGWAIVHGQHAAAYSALTWLSRTDAHPGDLPTGFAQAVAEALAAPGATV